MVSLVFTHSCTQTHCSFAGCHCQIPCTLPWHQSSGCIVPPQATIASFPGCHSQATIASFPPGCIVSFPGCRCLIPTQATIVSFPGCRCLISRLLLPHSQTAIVSFPGCCLVQGNTVAVHHKDQKGF